MASLSIESSDFRAPSNWGKVSGRWEITETANIAKYSQDFENNLAQPFGLVFCDFRMVDGTAQVDVSLDTPNEDSCARVVFRAAGNDSFYAAGIGGWGKAYTISRYTASGWGLLKGVGNHSVLDAQASYRVRLTLNGREVHMYVNDAIHLKHSESNPIEGLNMGLMAWRSPVTFSSFKATAPRPKAFVAMEFSDILDPIYNDVIFPVAVEAGFECRRASDLKSPGIIMDDIHDDIARAAVVIAEISTRNPNVYYEIGYASGKSQETILLAPKGTRLPFNVAERRCIMYENTPKGLDNLKVDLRRNLQAVAKLSI